MAWLANSSHLCDVGVHGPHPPPRLPPAQGFRSLPSNVFGSKVEGGFHFYFPGMHVFSQFDIKLSKIINTCVPKLRIGCVIDFQVL